MRPLALQANRLAPFGTVFTWVPREQNKAADRLVNQALDAASGVAPGGTAGESGTDPSPDPPARGWGPAGDPPTTLILVRHGATGHTRAKRFSGGLASSNPGLTDEGRAQVRVAGEWLQPMAGEVDALVTSPVRRSRESAEILAEFLGRQIEVEDGLAEMEFGALDALSFAEVGERYPDELSAWLGNLEYAPGGGESFRDVEKRVLVGRDRLVASYAGKTVVAVSHVTPIKVLVADALGAPLDALFRMELAAASVTVVSYFADPSGQHRANLRLFNGRPTGAMFG
jgi:probable phosphoglycerate mutase